MSTQVQDRVTALMLNEIRAAQDGAECQDELANAREVLRQVGRALAAEPSLCRSCGAVHYNLPHLIYQTEQALGFSGLTKFYAKTLLMIVVPRTDESDGLSPWDKAELDIIRWETAEGRTREAVAALLTQAAELQA